MKDVAGQLRLSLAQYRELEAFASFGSDLDPTSRAALERGARMVELLKQGQYAPFPVEEQVVSIWAGTTGRLDDVPVEDIRRFETELLDHLRTSHAGVLTEIRESGKKMDDATKDALDAAIKSFKNTFTVRDGSLLVNDAPVSALSKDEVGQETIKKHVPPADKK
jgi:F-type H+-transporting ATPase subunit alpha